MKTIKNIVILVTPFLLYLETDESRQNQSLNSLPVRNLKNDLFQRILCYRIWILAIKFYHPTRRLSFLM